jgi:hypothetical protein
MQDYDRVSECLEGIKYHMHPNGDNRLNLILSFATKIYNTYSEYNDSCMLVVAIAMISPFGPKVTNEFDLKGSARRSVYLSKVLI